MLWSYHVQSVVYLALYRLMAAPHFVQSTLALLHKAICYTVAYSVSCLLMYIESQHVSSGEFTLRQPL